MPYVENCGKMETCHFWKGTPVMWQQIIDYFTNNMDTYLTAAWEHVWISLLSLVIALAVGIPAGIYCAHTKRFRKWITAFFNVLRIVPSFAVLILLIPIMGTGVKPAMTALVILAIPPILMNTNAGFESTPEFMLETARGLGMTDRQIFQKVRIPLALPYILIGTKTALVEIIASATLAAYIGGGGLGTIIFTGLGLNRTDLLLIGGISVALLSLFSGFLVTAAEKWIVRYR